MLLSSESAQLFFNDQIDSTSTSSDLSSIISSSSPTIQTDFILTDTPEYLSQLLKDRRQLAAVPNVFLHVERLLDQEINNVRINLFNLITRPKLELPKPEGEKKIFQEKVFIPIQQYPEYNFIGRILGPRGLSAKQFETETGCKIIVRGRGSFRDARKEEESRVKPNYEHLNEELHVILQCEDYENRASIKLEHGKEELLKLLKPPIDGEKDHLKKKQLTELAMIKGTYRDPNIFSKKISLNNNQISIGAPLILTPHIQQNLLTPQLQSSNLFSTTQTQPTLNTIPQNNESNFLQVFTPLQTIEQIGGILANGTHLFEYSNQSAFPFLTTTSPTGVTTRSTTTSSVRYQPYTIQPPRHNRS